MPNSQLNQMFRNRTKKLYAIIDYLWENRWALLEKQKAENSFHDNPADYIPSGLYRDMSPDMVDAIDGILTQGLIRGGLTKSFLLDQLMPY